MGWFRRNSSFKKCQQTFFWSKFVKSGPLKFFLFTFWIKKIFFQLPSKSGKSLIQIALLDLEILSFFPRILLFILQKNQMRLFSGRRKYQFILGDQDIVHPSYLRRLGLVEIKFRRGEKISKSIISNWPLT